MTKKPVYPKSLKQENWRKSKGFIANIAGGGETGIGTAMRQLTRRPITMSIGSISTISRPSGIYTWAN